MLFYWFSNIHTVLQEPTVILLTITNNVKGPSVGFVYRMAPGFVEALANYP